MNMGSEKEVTVRHESNEAFSFAAFFCEKHKDGAHTVWNNILMDPPVSSPMERSREEIKLDDSFAGMISINRLVHNVNYSHFLPLSNSHGNQVKVIIDYSAISPSIIGKPINAVMEVYSLDSCSLVRTTSLLSPIIANETGTVQLATTFTDKTLTDVISIITLTDGSKSVPVSDPIHFPLGFADPST